MTNTTFRKIAVVAVLGMTISGEAWAINDRATPAAPAANNICFRQAAAPLPDVISRENVKIVGVSMGPNGELKRYRLKQTVLDGLPNYLGLADPNFFNQLSASDYEEDLDVPTGAETPLDISAAQETVIYYTLLPDSWYFDDIPLSLKMRDEPGRSAFITLPSEAVNRKTALLYKSDQSDSLYRFCMYHFNLNVTIEQGEEGARLYTPIIIDPAVSNLEHPEASSGTDMSEPEETDEDAEETSTSE